MAPKKETLTPVPVYPDIIIALHYLSSDPLRFHRAIFVQINRELLKGTKFHAISDTNSATGWSYCIHSAYFALAGTIEDFGAFPSKIPIGAVPEADKGREASFSCRVWVREALRRLDGAGYIRCPDVDAMEKEMWEYGAQAAADIDAETFQGAKLVKAKNSM